MTAIRRVLGVAFLILLVLAAVQVNVSLAGKNSRLKDRVASLETKVTTLESQVQSNNAHIGALYRLASDPVSPEQVVTDACSNGQNAIWVQPSGGGSGAPDRVHLSC